MKSYVMDDGRWHHRFRQSWINTAETCPERARLDGTVERRETDAAAIGTGVHYGIESTLKAQMVGGSYTLADAIALMEERFEEIEANPTFVWTKYSKRTAMKFGATCLTGWWNLVRPTLQPLAMEQRFCHLLYEDDKRLIEVSGTIDYLDVVRGLGDWKTSSRGPYETWQYERSAVQPTVYTWANVYGAESFVTDLDHVPFTYFVMHANGVQEFTVHRGPNDWRWLEQRCLSFAALIEADLDVWPMNDNHALCSAKWCDAWASCKGKFYLEEMHA